jgi:20S proteasome alpha/beta subunit
MSMLKRLPLPTNRPIIKRLPTGRPRVTIAVGFKLDNSILLCTDSFFTDGVTQHYGDKIFRHPLGKDIDTLFAIAGSVPHAQSLIQHLRNVMAGKHHSLALASETILQETAEFNNTHQASIGDVGLQLIAAIRHRDEGLSLMVCDGSACYEATEPYAFIGCGRSIAKPLTDWAYSFTKTDEDRALLAFSVLYAIKSIDPNCNGITQYGTICRDSSKDFLDTKDGLLEQESYASCFARAAVNAFFGCTNRHSADQVSQRLNTFGEMVKMLHGLPDMQKPKI